MIHYFHAFSSKHSNCEIVLKSFTVINLFSLFGVCHWLLGSIEKSLESSEVQLVRTNAGVKWCDQILADCLVWGFIDNFGEPGRGSMLISLKSKNINTCKWATPESGLRLIMCVCQCVPLHWKQLINFRSKLLSFPFFFCSFQLVLNTNVSLERLVYY